MLLVAVLVTLAVAGHALPVEEYLLADEPAFQPKYPVVMVPGLEGSQLEATVDKPSTVNWLCTKTTRNWFQIWVNPKEFLPGVIDCFIDNMKMSYNKATRRSQNAPGVQIRPVGFGRTDGIEFLSKDALTHIGPLSYFNDLVNALVGLGYERNVNLRGAPYDFRNSPHDNENWVRDVKALVEETVTVANNKPAVLVCHSMGCMYSLYFLNQQTQSWKDSHIKELITMAAPWAGAAKAAVALAQGSNLNIFIVDQKKFRGMERSFPSSYFLLPSKPFYTDPIWSVNGQEFTASDFDKFFAKLNLSDGQLMWEDSMKLGVANMTHPGVDVSCIHGSGVDTPAHMTFDNDSSFPDSPTVTNGDGDGTVNIQSLEACTVWSTSKQFKFDHQVLPTVTHLKTVKDATSVAYVVRKVTSYL